MIGHAVELQIFDDQRQFVRLYRAIAAQNLGDGRITQPEMGGEPALAFSGALQRGDQLFDGDHGDSPCDAPYFCIPEKIAIRKFRNLLDNRSGVIEIIPMNPAQLIIERLGGEAQVSFITGTAYTAPYRWQAARAKGGTGGLIPQRYHRRLIDYARAKGIPLAAEEFLAAIRRRTGEEGALMSVVESLHEARKARLQRIAARAVPQSERESASTPVVVRVPAPDRDYERAWALEIMGYADRRPRKPRVSDIQRAVAEHFGVPLDDMLSPDQTHVMARPRHVAMYLARELTAKSFPQIGRRFGRGHATVLHAVSRIEDMIAHDAELAASVDRIRDLLQTRENWL